MHLVSVPGMARSHPYLRPDGSGWADNPARFLAFSRAVAAMVRRDPPDVLHLNDWHTGAVLAALPAPPPSVLTLHNVAYQGVTDGSWLRRIGPRGRHYEWWGGTNPLSGGIALADAVVAVSPTYAREILTPAGGFGLDGPLRDRGAAVSGIRNGIDTARWDPATDRHLAATFSVDRARPHRRGAGRQPAGAAGPLRVARRRDAAGRRGVPADRAEGHRHARADHPRAGAHPDAPDRARRRRGGAGPVAGRAGRRPPASRSPSSSATTSRWPG